MKWRRTKDTPEKRTDKKRRFNRSEIIFEACQSGTAVLDEDRELDDRYISNS